MAKKISWLNTNSGLLVLRIGVGAIFIFSGWMKVSNLSATVGMFATMGFGAFWAYLVSAVELVGGVCVLLGAYTRVFAGLLAITMVVAVIAVSSNMTMVMTPLSVLFSTLALMLAGGGKYAVMKNHATNA